MPSRNDPAKGRLANPDGAHERPPAHLLPALAEALGITTDQLLGIEPISARKKPTNIRLLRKLQQVEELPPRARAAVLEHIDALVSKHRRG